VFALARFDRVTAQRQGLIQGQGEVIQFAIPMKAPWIPLRILTLGKVPAEAVNADLFVLTDHRPTFAPALHDFIGMHVRANEPASGQLLADLRSDRSMGWLPASGMWLTALSLDTRAATVLSDLSIDGGGPVPSAAAKPVGTPAVPAVSWLWLGAIGLLAVVAMVAIGDIRRPRAAVNT
jgi:hypothetical protein